MSFCLSFSLALTLSLHLVVLVPLDKPDLRHIKMQGKRKAKVTHDPQLQSIAVNFVTLRERQVLMHMKSDLNADSTGR